jgi:hypothetical protein
VLRCALNRLGLVASAALLLGLAGCSSTNHSQGLPHGRTTILPTEPPYVAPSAADLTDLQAASSVVIEATLGDTPKTQQLTAGRATVTKFYTPLASVRILGYREQNSATETMPLPAIDSLGASWSTIEPPGRYLLFLDGETPVNGMYGIFQIKNGTLVRHCPNYSDLAHPLLATGTRPSVAEVEAAIPKSLPTRPVPPKPSSALESPSR